MLGRLLHLGSGGQSTGPTQSNNGSRPILSLESVQEDSHTRNLLFPDAQDLYQHRNDQVFPFFAPPVTSSASPANAFDYNDDIELDVKDVRVIIMQDALGPTNASLLYDSHPLPESAASAERHSTATQDLKRAVPFSPRKGSQSQAPRPTGIHTDGPQLRQGAFDRRASVHGRSPSFGETDGQRAAREYREELATFSSCIFGNSELMAYKGTSTKVHVVPSEPRITDYGSSMFGDGRSSIGRASGRSSKLSQSYSSQTMSPTHPPLPTGASTPRQSERKKVLITRLFPITLAADDLDTATPPSRYSDDNGGFPFPPTGDESAAKKKKPQPKQRRTPMYAVVLVVQLPPSPSRISSAVPPKPVFREPGSYNDQDLFSSSYSSTRASGWNMSGSGLYGEATDSSFSIDVEDRIDSLTKHWDIVMRTLTHLQSVVSFRLHTMLKQTDMASPGPYSANLSSRRPSVTTDRRLDESRIKPSKSTTKLVSLLPNCLSDDVHIASEVGLARTRVVMGLSASRVVTGQGRWGIWRDEAIWTCKWAAGLHQGVFLHTLLTGFLATHVDWLQALSSPTYRRRALIRKQNQNEDDLSLPARTIIVSEDKMAARRIIFLLSAFLPANQQVHGPRVHRPSTSGASVGAFSNSPPSYVVPVVREESLRRKINRRTGFGRTSHSRTASQSTRSGTLSSQMGHLNITDPSSHQRRASDAASIRTPGLPIPGHDLMSRKSSVATSTIMQDSTTPHFSTIQRTDSLRRRRPGSSGSAAADDLKRSLKRGESGSAGGARPPSQGLRWSSIMSGLWNARRRESMDSGSTYSQASDLRSPIKAGFPQSNRLSDIGRELAPHEEVPGRSLTGHLRQASNARDVDATRGNAERTRKSFTQADRTPDPTGAFESPVKTSINADDGVIDVDVPFPDYIASFESAISSPSSSGYLSTPGLPGLESFEQTGRISIDGDLPLNAAGWLNRFHPDFVLQGVPPQEDLLEKVKAALQAEPTPAVLQSGSDDVSERWVDVSSALVVDTTTDSILRITYRRLVKPRPVVENVVGGVAITPSALPQETMLDEKWVEELVSVPDETLSEALEKVIHLIPDSSKEHSSASSQVHVDILGPLDTGSTMPDTLSEVTQIPEPPLEIPRRQCKTVVLSALEDTIRDVIDRSDDDTPNNFGPKQQPPASENVLRLAVRQWANTLDSSE